MKLTTSLLALTALALAAPADARAADTWDRVAQTAVVDTVIQPGTYELSIAFGGGLLEATLEIAIVRDSLTAVLKLGDHDSPVKAGARRGNKLTLEPASAGVDVRYELEFSGESVKGTFVYQGESGTVTGKRRPPRS